MYTSCSKRTLRPPFACPRYVHKKLSVTASLQISYLFQKLAPLGKFLGKIGTLESRVLWTHSRPPTFRTLLFSTLPANVTVTGLRTAPSW